MVISGVSKTLTVIDQLISGLSYLGGLFLEYIRAHKEVMRSLFTLDGAKNFQPTSELLLDGVKVEFSEDGSNLKAGEVDIYKYFSDYVMDLGESEGKFLCCLLKKLLEFSIPYSSYVRHIQ